MPATGVEKAEYEDNREQYGHEAEEAIRHYDEAEHAKDETIENLPHYEVGPNLAPEGMIGIDSNVVREQHQQRESEEARERDERQRATTAQESMELETEEVKVPRKFDSSTSTSLHKATIPPTTTTTTDNEAVIKIPPHHDKTQQGQQVHDVVDELSETVVLNTETGKLMVVEDTTNPSTSSSSSSSTSGASSSSPNGTPPTTGPDSDDDSSRRQSYARRLDKSLELTITMQNLAYYIPRKKPKEKNKTKKKFVWPWQKKKVDQATTSSESGGADVSSSRAITPIPDKRLYLLKDINATVLPGQMTMIMGASGSGKSTLLDVIAGRKTYGHIEGELLFNGFERPRNFRRLCGYVEQADILLGTLTPRQSLYFTARMRLSSKLSETQINEKVDFVLTTLGLEKCADTVIGNQNLRGISGGEAKRVNIGLELITRPSMLFLDEPTSGLDSSIAFDLIQFVRRITDTGTGVLCTIHQPSKDIFELFDRILLLSAGSIAFFGPVSMVVNYFIDLGYIFEEGSNPADFVVEILSGSHRIKTHTELTEERNEQFFIQKYKESQMSSERMYSIQQTVAAQQQYQRERLEKLKREQEQQELQEGVNKSHHHHILHREKKPKQTLSDFDQPLFVNNAVHNTEIILQRNIIKAKRNPHFWLNRVIVPSIVALILLLIYLDSPRDRQGIRNRQSLIMLTVTFFTIGTNQLIGDFIQERIVFTRERNAATYQVSAYYVGTLLVEVPAMILKAIIWINLIYWTTPFALDPGRYFFFLLVGVILTDLGLASAQLFAYLFEGIETAVSAFIVFALINLIFSGFFIRKPDIPSPWIWAYYLSYANYAVAALAINEFTSDVEYTEESSFCVVNNSSALCPVPGTGNCFLQETVISPDDALTMVGAQTSGMFSSKWMNLLFIVIYWVVLRYLAYLALRFKKHGRK